VYIQLPKIGESVTAEKVCGEVESTKSVSEIYAPLTGKIVTVNSSLDKVPETINSDPYGAGWIAEIEIVGDLAGAVGLLTSGEYEQLTA
jgi:glycine cleavage system H protein